MRTGLGIKIVQLVTDDPDATRCPHRRVRLTSCKDWGLTRPLDLPCGGEVRDGTLAQAALALPHARLSTADSTEQVGHVPAGMRTTRLRAALAVAVEDGRDQAEVVTAHRVSRPTVQRAVVAHGAIELAEPKPLRCWAWTRPGSVGRGDCPTGTTTTAGSARSARTRGRPHSSTSPDIRGCWGRSTTGPAPGCRPGLPRSPAFRAGGDRPHAGYAATVRDALPTAAIAVDPFHLIMLADKAVTAVRQRVTRELLATAAARSTRRWANRRLLPRGRERLSPAALARMWNGCPADPTGQILSAWIAKEEQRALCAAAVRGGHPGEIRDRLYAFYRWCADAGIPELTTLAETIETWWPAIEVFLTTALTNARTEGAKR